MVPTGPRPMANAIVRPQQEFPVDLAKRSEPADQGVLERGAGGRGVAGARQVPAQEFAPVAIDHQGERRPAVLAGPDPRQIRRPALVRRRGDRGHRLDPRSHADGALAHLPALDLKDPLHRRSPRSLGPMAFGASPL